MCRRTLVSVLALQQLFSHSHSFATLTPRNDNSDNTCSNPYPPNTKQIRREGDCSSAIIQPTRDPDELLSAIDNVLVRSNANRNLLLDRSEILSRIDSDHCRDAKACSSLPAETDPSTSNDIDYEWIYVEREEGAQQHPIAIRTKGSIPLLDAHSIQRIRSAAERHWCDPTNSGTTSRFTYQRKGNYEVHLNDLAGQDPTVHAIANDLLRNKVYPLIRRVFGSSDLVVDDMDALRFCVYDSLIIRYNATEANSGVDSSTLIGAGQPLHRDLGLISVNIMLNSDDEFAGGGTAFENQFGASDVISCRPLKPIGPGHALSHLSSERHAGAGTTEGVRDILVMFITATDVGVPSRGQSSLPAPRLERCARLKAAARGESQRFENAVDAAICRALYQRLAVDVCDGEAFHYLGMALRDIAEASDDETGIQHMSLDCLLHATFLTPSDGRLYNNLGLSFGQVCMQQNQQALYDLVRKCFEKSALLHRSAQLAGCDVGHELDASILNHGLFLANQDRFEEAAAVLERVSGVEEFWQTCGASREDLSESEFSHLRILQDASDLHRFCVAKSKASNGGM